MLVVYKVLLGNRLDIPLSGAWPDTKLILYVCMYVCCNCDRINEPLKLRSICPKFNLIITMATSLGTEPIIIQISKYILKTIVHLK